MKNRKRFTYANVASTLLVFLALAGGTAFAASQLGKNSVGTKQLKKNAVTTAKLKKNAVTKAKIKKGAVTGAKIADGSIGVGDVNVASTPFSRVVTRLRSSAVAEVPSGKAGTYPLSPSTYVQGADELNTYRGAITLSFAPTCEAPRRAVAYLTVDLQDPNKLTELDLAAAGEAVDATGANPVQRVNMGPFLFLGSRFEPGVPTTRTLSIVTSVMCKSGSGATASDGAVDVIGIR